jgi:hypothetical protein
MDRSRKDWNGGMRYYIGWAIGILNLAVTIYLHKLNKKR